MVQEKNGVCYTKYMTSLEHLKALCVQVRRYILTATTQASSGHPTSSLSAVELMTTLFFGGFLQQDVNEFQNIHNDRVIFSKGHASPLLYSLYTTAGVLSQKELMTLRKFGSPLQGHPTPDLPFVDVATGSLGQGLSVGVGMALAMKNIASKSQILNLKSQSNPNLKIPKEKNDLEFKVSDLGFTKILPRVFVLLGDSEMAEGQNWEAMTVASKYKLGNLVGILDVNRLGQRGETLLGWDIHTYQKRIESFGWKTVVIEDGHNLKEISSIFNDQFSKFDQRPLMFIAKTIKGKGCSIWENKNGWHGKPLTKEQLPAALKELGKVDFTLKGSIKKPQILKLKPQSNSESQILNAKKRELFQITQKLTSYYLKPMHPPVKNYQLPTANYQLQNSYSTREAFGDSLSDLGENHKNIVVLDAETANSTYEDKFEKKYPERFFEMYIAEQNMVSTALGFSKMGYIPFVSTFAAFFTRAFDQIRMTQYSISTYNAQRISRNAQTIKNVTRYAIHDTRDVVDLTLNIVGSHAGVSIGEDGSSQMGLEDIAMMRSIRESTILYPSDAVSAYKLTQEMAAHPGINYMRTTRMKTPIIYDEREEFKIGGLKIHQSKVKDPHFAKASRGEQYIWSKPQTINYKLQTNNYRAVIIAAGITLHEALKAQTQLAEKGISVIVVDLYSIKPMDEKTITKLAQQTNHIVVVEDHYPGGGIGEAISSVLTANYKLRAINYHFSHLCVRKPPCSGTPEELLRYEEIDAEEIVKSILL